MSGPDHALFPCEGCGERLPAGTEVCPRCGRRLVGPSPAPRPPVPAMRPEPEDFRQEPESTTTKVVAGFGSFLGKLAAAVGIAVASLISFVVALFTACSIDTKGTYMTLDLGVAAAAAIGIGVALTAAFVRSTRAR